MRTTLKRGMGRGAAVNGNGRPVFPPAAITAMTRYRQPEPARRGALRLLGRILLVALIVVLVIGTGLLGGAYLYFHENVSAIQAHTPAVKIAEKRLAVALPGKPSVALVIGYDHRAGIEKDLESRSDTLMLLRSDPVTKSVSMLSFPRDLLVDLHCPGHPTYVDRINRAYADCGPKGTLETIKALTGLSVNYLITVNFRGFKQTVDKLGGVWVDVDRHYFNDNRGRITGLNTFATINLMPGYQNLNGQQALDFVRFRHTDSDLFRVARQQLFVKAMKQQLAHAFRATSLPKFVHAITSNIEVGVGGGQPLSAKTVLSYAFFAYELPPGHFFQPRVENLQPAGPALAELSATPQAIQDAVREFTSPDVAAPAKATAAALGQRLRTGGIRPREVSVTVLNGNGVLGARANTAFELAQQGFTVLSPPVGSRGNAPTFNYFHTKAYYDPTVARAREGARKVADLFGDADVEAVPTEIQPLQNRAMVTVVLGQTFHGTLAPTPVDRTPKRQAPVVRADPAASIDLLRPLRVKVPFPLEAPHLVERASHPDPELPVRVYNVKQNRAVRLVFRTSTNEYWGIEETNWNDAPVLQGANLERVLGGRHFDLYYSGAHLHMIVLRENGATYWLVNTLLDSLSNETMLSIAKSLRTIRG